MEGSGPRIFVGNPKVDRNNMNIMTLAGIAPATRIDLEGQAKKMGIGVVGLTAILRKLYKNGLYKRIKSNGVYKYIRTETQLRELPVAVRNKRNFSCSETVNVNDVIQMLKARHSALLSEIKKIEAAITAMKGI